MSNDTQYWMARYDVVRYVGIHHAPPPPMPEEILAAGRLKQRWPRRYHWTIDESPGREFPDFPFSFGGELIMSPRACEVLLPMIEPWVWLERDVEIDTDRGYVAAVLTEEYDCFDEQKSRGTRGTVSGAWLEVQDLTLRTRKIGAAPIFRLPTRTIQWRPILSAPIAHAIATHGLTGLALQPADVLPYSTGR